MELPWADYNLLKKRQRSILTFAECQILQCDNTHVLEKFTRSQSQEGRQGAELEPVLVCVAGRKSVRFSCTIHHLSLKPCSLPNTAIVLQGVWCCWPKTLSLFYQCTLSISGSNHNDKSERSYVLATSVAAFCHLEVFLWGCAQKHGGLWLGQKPLPSTSAVWHSFDTIRIHVLWWVIRFIESQFTIHTGPICFMFIPFISVLVACHLLQTLSIFFSIKRRLRQKDVVLP